MGLPVLWLGAILNRVLLYWGLIMWGFLFIWYLFYYTISLCYISLIVLYLFICQYKRFYIVRYTIGILANQRGLKIALNRSVFSIQKKKIVIQTTSYCVSFYIQSYLVYILWLHLIYHYSIPFHNLLSFLYLRLHLVCNLLYPHKLIYPTYCTSLYIIVA